ncbi:MAG: ligase-associated DNA damage response exonuclease [Candidatus Melainabacteria bacterium]|nr:ligase-associated DNA damage response exonuclease [Candidatus Melainabacteria bacterium]
MAEDLVRVSDQGLYCPSGDFYIDPWRPVKRALVTHGHSDHARPGSAAYLTQTDSKGILRLRLGEEAKIETINYGVQIAIEDAIVSFHPAGHILGSSQIRIEHKGQICVVSGDYKTQRDPSCQPIETVRCHTFITESTFGLPIYRFPSPEIIAAEVNQWWQANASDGKVSILYAYSLGKAQRLLMSVDQGIGPIYTHGAVEALNTVYRGCGVKLPHTTYVGDINKDTMERSALVVAPPNAQDSLWARKFGKSSDAFVSGWMRVRGARRRRSLDRGFVMSDHADWQGLTETIAATGAERVLVTHGYTPPLVRYLTELGIDAHALETAFSGEEGENSEIGSGP